VWQAKNLSLGRWPKNFTLPGRISLGYQMRFKSRILQLLKKGEVPIAYCERCDVTQPEELAKFFAGLSEGIDVLVHSIAYASPESLAKPIHAVEQEEFRVALVTSSYSLIPLVRAAADKMAPGASVIAMTYLGGQRVVANYRLMGIAKAALDATVRELAADVGPRGIRVNAISAGPIKTLAASQIGGFNEMLKVYETVAPLRRSITQGDVGNMAVFLGSELSSAVTGQVLYVDAGYSILAMAELPKEA
jgi:enoyl-[acyl-carrier protein] reductase I